MRVKCWCKDNLCCRLRWPWYKSLSSSPSLVQVTLKAWTCRFDQLRRRSHVRSAYSHQWCCYGMIQEKKRNQSPTIQQQWLAFCWQSPGCFRLFLPAGHKQSVMKKSNACRLCHNRGHRCGTPPTTTLHPVQTAFLLFKPLQLVYITIWKVCWIGISKKKRKLTQLCLTSRCLVWLSSFQLFSAMEI